MKNNKLECHSKLLGKSLREVVDPRNPSRSSPYYVDNYFTGLIHFYTCYYHPRHLIPTLSPLRASRFGPKRGILLHPVFSDLSYEYFHLYYDY